MYENICYDRPFLKEVIARIDFAAPIGSLGTAIPQRIANTALERFPILEERKALAQEFMLSAEEIRHKRQQFSEWNYHGRDRQKRLAIAPSFAYVTYSRYSSFEELKDDFFGVIAVLFENYTDLRAARLGLRYINQIDQQGHDPFLWNDLIDPTLLALFNRFADQRSSVSRFFHIAEFKHEDDIQVKFQFGVPNPDYPAPIRTPQFVLDMDAHFDGLQTLEDLRDHLDLCHAYIQHLFETSITDELRRLMNAQG
jgi:uncharacterized protein (TIGR04255 family)